VYGTHAMYVYDMKKCRCNGVGPCKRNQAKRGGKKLC